MRRGGALALFLACSPFVPPAPKREAAADYFPGTISSFLDGVPPTETLILRLNALCYEGSLTAGKAIPIARRRS